MTATNAVEAVGLGKCYRRGRWALRDCTIEIPEGRVVGLVGSNGAGKTTLLHIAVGLLAPTTGTITVFGGAPGRDVEQLGRVAFLAQDAPLYRQLSVADHLEVGRHLNRTWDGELASKRLDHLGFDPKQRTGDLSGGQRAQLALTLAIAKRPRLLVLDEPVASLDPLARREFLQGLMEAVADQGLTVILSSHLLADVERVCDHVVVIDAGQVCLAGDVEDLLARHRSLTGPSEDLTDHAYDDVVVTDQVGRQTTLLVKRWPLRHAPSWSVREVGLEELVLAYMGAHR